MKQINILLADDDHDDRHFFEQALNELPITTQLTTVFNGEQLMNYLTNDGSEDFQPFPDVLFLDINMPRKNGFECLTEIKQNKKLKDLPVVIFSTSNSHDKINMLFKGGAHVFVHKTSDFEQLKEVIHHALPIATEKMAKNGNVKYILNA